MLFPRRYLAQTVQTVLNLTKYPRQKWTAGQWRFGPATRAIILATAILAAFGVAPGACATTPDSGARLDKQSVSVAGRSEALLTVEDFGRYAITVQSAQGVALQIIDRMAGPGEIEGMAGEEDGRSDPFLDRGTYKVVMFGPEKGRGDAKLAVHPFVEKNSFPPPALVELKLVSSQLRDFEQISFVCDVVERRNVIFEAAGRDLADLRLWQDGSWLVDAIPTVESITPQPGRSLTLCRLHADLAPGSYVLTAYGGPSQPWTEESDEHPFYLRVGIPPLAEAGRMRYVASPFGFDRWLVPPETNLFRLELPEASPATLHVDWFDPDEPFARGGSSVDISKNSSPPAAEIDLSGKPIADSEKDRLRIVTVRSEAGRPYVLQHFLLADAYELNGSGDYWLSTIRTGGATDNLAPTVILVRARGEGDHPTDPLKDRVEPYAARVVELDRSTTWSQRFNLLGEATLFLHVGRQAQYQVLAAGVDARFRIEPFLLNRPHGYEVAPLQAAGSMWDLDPGTYVLTMVPETKGILDLAVGPAEIGDILLKLIGRPREPGAPGALRPSARFSPIHLEADKSYHAYVNRVPETKLGFVLRPLPCDLTIPLPIAQGAGDTVVVPFEAKEALILRAEAEDGSLLDISVDGAPPVTSPEVPPGLHTASVVVDSAAVHYALTAEPVPLAAEAPVAAIPTPAGELPSFPTLDAGSPAFLDLDRQEGATYFVRADEPGLYRLESTGLIATSGNLRTRIIPSLDRREENGVGRNFLIQQYLNEGDYQITVAARGRTRGHLGVVVRRTPLADAGELKPGTTGRLTLQAGQAASYWLVVPEAGEYSLEAAGLSGEILCRLEDEDGWPIAPPSISASMARHFDPGRYRLVLLPGAADARVVTRFERVLPPLHFEGHGPHALPLATRVAPLWSEPVTGSPRDPDLWLIDIPAPCEVAIDLTGEMQGIVKKSDSGAEIAFVPPGQGWKGKLETGRYILEAVCSRRNHLADYEIEIEPVPLVAGISRTLTAPISIDVAVGSEGLTELESSGRADVRAELYDADGRLVARNDDRSDDWNFQIALPLREGLYRLKIEPVGAAQAGISVAMHMPQKIEERALRLPASETISPGDAVHLFPLEVVPGEGDLLLAAAQSAEAVACALEGTSEGTLDTLRDRSADGAWKTLALATGREVRLAVPLPETSARYRLRVWSLDRRGGTVRFTAGQVETRRVTESSLRGGARLLWAPGIFPPTAVAKILLDRPGLIRLESPPGALLWSGAPWEACEAVADPVLAASANTIWLAAGAEATVRGERVFLGAATEQSVQCTLPRGGPGRCDLAIPAAKRPVPTAALATSEAGQPGVRLADRADTLGLAPAGAGMAVASGAALAVALSAKEPIAVVWPASAGSAPIAVRLTSFTFEPPAGFDSALGSSEGSVAAGAARELRLSPGLKRIRLALGAGLAGVLSSGGAVESVHWRGGEPFEETIESTALALTILNLGTSDEGRYAVAPFPVQDGIRRAVVAHGAPFEHVLDSAGTLRLEIPPMVDPVQSILPSALHIRTAALPRAGSSGMELPTLVDHNGIVQDGTDLVVDAGGGTLLLPSEGGLVLAYLDRPGEDAQDLWGPPGDTPVRQLTPPALVPLVGRTLILRCEADSPQMIHLRSAAPSVSKVRFGEEPAEVTLHPTGTSLDLYLPGGSMEIALRALAGATLFGDAEITATPVTPITEGLGPETLLPAGGARVFSFQVPREGPIGVGVRASSDLVEATLLDAHGRPLGMGLVQMPTVVPGAYLLTVRAPASGPPVTVRPALAGITPPGTGPPAEVIRGYLETQSRQPAPRGAGAARGGS